MVHSPLANIVRSAHYSLENCIYDAVDLVAVVVVAVSDTEIDPSMRYGNLHLPYRIILSLSKVYSVVGPRTTITITTMATTTSTNVLIAVPTTIPLLFACISIGQILHDTGQ